MNNIKIVEASRDVDQPITYLFRDKVSKSELWYQLPPNFMLLNNKIEIIDNMWKEAVSHFYKIRGQK